MLVANVSDSTSALSDLMRSNSRQEVLEGALAHAATLVPQKCKGFAVLRQGSDVISAVMDYPADLVGLVVNGPWTQGKTRLLSEGSKDLYNTNHQEIVRHLDQAGMHETKTSVVIPLINREKESTNSRGVAPLMGAMVLDFANNVNLNAAQLESLSDWAAAVSPLLSLFETREEWRLMASDLTTALVGAVDGRDIDTEGHSLKVAQVAMAIGRLKHLSDRELEQLWYGALLHSIGKIVAEEGYANIGANFLDGVPKLSGARLAIRHHQERWDGSGKPDGLKGENIPLLARIVTIANDLVVAGSADRIQPAQAGTKLDPALLPLARSPQVEAILKEMQ